MATVDALSAGPLEPLQRRRLRRTGRLMIAVAVIGVAAAALISVAAWRVLGQINQASENSIAVTVESLDAVDNTIDLADEVVGSTSEAVDAIEQTLDTVAASTDTATGVVDSVGDLSGSAGPAFANAEKTLRELAEIGSTIDGVLNSLSRLPIGPDYRPTAQFGPTMGELADALEPLPAALATTTTELDTFSESTDDVRVDVEELAESVALIGDRLDARGDVVDQYRRNVASARDLGLKTAEDLDANLRFARIVVLVAGAAFALGQIVPLSYGRMLLARART